MRRCVKDENGQLRGGRMEGIRWDVVIASWMQGDGLERENIMLGRRGWCEMGHGNSFTR